MFRLRSLLSAVLTLAVLAPAAHAQYDQMMGGAKPRWYHFGIGGGVSVPVNDAEKAFENGFNGLAYVRVMPPGFPVSLGVNVSFSQLDLSDAVVSTSGPGVTSGNTQMLAGLADLKFDLMKLGPITPYVIAGIGAYNMKTALEGGSTTPPSDTQFGVNGGAGLTIAFGRISAYIQGRVDNVYTSDGGAIDKDAIQVVPVSLGIEF